MRWNYAGMVDQIRGKPIWNRWVVFLAKVFPLTVIILYIGTSLFLLFTQNEQVWLFLAVPAFCFVLVTVLRKRIHRVRPYDAMGYLPLLPKESGKANSFPSRHTASAWVIACACWYLSPVFGSIMILIALLVGVTRVLTGVHYLSDVLAGIGLALLCSILFFLPFPG